MPAEKARWSRALARPTTKRAGSANTSGSRLAAPSRTVTRMPGRTSRPASDATSFTVRPVSCTGLSYRRIAGERPAGAGRRARGAPPGEEVPPPFRGHAQEVGDDEHGQLRGIRLDE